MSKIAVIGLVGNSAFLRVEKFHEAGETVHANAIHFEPGGKGFNQAVAAARFGSQVSFLGAVGAQYKQEIEQFLAHEHIDAFLVQKKESTAFAAILTDATGANQVTVYRGAQLDVCDVEPFRHEIECADILLINNEVPAPVNEKAISIAKQSGTFVILNPAPSVPLCDYILQNVDLFTPNEHELAQLEGRDNVIVTLGSRGCLLKQSNTHLDAAKIAHVVDTTGAGDTFNGVLAHALSERMDPQSAAKLAIAASGVSVTKPYAASAIPTRAQVAAYYKDASII